MEKEAAKGIRHCVHCTSGRAVQERRLCFFCAEAWLIGTAFGHDCRIPIPPHQDNDKDEQRMRHQSQSL